MENSIWSLLLNDVSLIETKFHMAREDHHFDFEKDIVPFTKLIDDHIHLMHQSTNLFFTQRSRIESLIQPLSVSCHDKRTSKKQFFDQLKTIKHDLLTIQRQVENGHV